MAPEHRFRGTEPKKKKHTHHASWFPVCSFVFWVFFFLCVNAALFLFKLAQNQVKSQRWVHHVNYEHRPVQHQTLAIAGTNSPDSRHTTPSTVCPPLPRPLTPSAWAGNADTMLRRRSCCRNTKPPHPQNTEKYCLNLRSWTQQPISLSNSWRGIQVGK